MRVPANRKEQVGFDEAVAFVLARLLEKRKGGRITVRVPKDRKLALLNVLGNLDGDSITAWVTPVPEDVRRGVVYVEERPNPYFTSTNTGNATTVTWTFGTVPPGAAQ